MMGRQKAAQAPLFYAFNLEDHVPANHLLRGIDRFLDLDGLHQHLSPHYSHTGRPSIDPALLIRMLIVGYCFGIRSELCRLETELASMVERCDSNASSQPCPALVDFSKRSSD